MSHGSVAASVRKRKEEHPERYCPVPKCLWRTGGGHCPKHQAKLPDGASAAGYTDAVDELLTKSLNEIGRP